MLGKHPDFYTEGASAEEALRLKGHSEFTKEQTDALFYKEAAKRVLMDRCYGVCNIDSESLNYFGKQFYYNLEN